MKIVADQNMSGVAALFAPYGEVELCDGRRLCARQIRDADALLVRSVTQVDEQLLANSKVRFVGSSTSGIDHIDQAYLQARDIHFAYAPGCNAVAVVEYVVSALCAILPDWRNRQVGIIGCGRVGGRLLQYLQALGVTCKVYDPFLTPANCDVLTNLTDVLDADVVTLHTPLTQSGEYPTRHLLNGKLLDGLASAERLLINSARGEVVDNAALLRVLERSGALRVVLDVWENEPSISIPLLSKVTIGTPHIAGYSQEGRLRGTQMVLDAFCRWLGQPMCAPLDFGNPESLVLPPDATLDAAVLAAYDVTTDAATLRRAMDGTRVDVGSRFDILRKACRHRREFSHFRISGIGGEPTRAALRTLGFRID